MAADPNIPQSPDGCPAGASTKGERLVSLDVFRGFVILTMVFVNYLPGMSRIPQWLLHAPADFDGFAPTDVVFPGFLFIVGVAIPLAIERRLSRGETRTAILRHVLVRAAALVFLGG